MLSNDVFILVALSFFLFFLLLNFAVNCEPLIPKYERAKQKAFGWINELRWASAVLKTS